MNYAIIETGGKQYRVQPGQTITVEKLPGDVGSTVEIDRVLLLAQDGAATVGTPTVEGAKVVAEVAEQGRGDKVIVFKYKRKVRYQVKQGHRQSLTKLSIKEIVGAGGASAAPKCARSKSSGA